MEHRWGERVSVHLAVELSCGASAPVAGLLENVSSSGGFVRTEARLPRGAVEVALIKVGAERGSRVRLPAYIVRESESGVGIEWCEFAPRAVRELMRRDRRAGGRARARSLPPMRRRESNTVTEPLAQSMAEPAGVGAGTPSVAASLGEEARAAR